MSDAERFTVPDEIRPFGREELVELQLLLPVRQMERLEQEARQAGLTIGHMLRRLVADYVAGAALPVPGRVVDLPTENAARLLSRLQ